MFNNNNYTEEYKENEYQITIKSKIIQPGNDVKSAIAKYINKLGENKCQPQKLELDQRIRDRIIVSLAVVGRAPIQGIQEHIGSIYGVKVSTGTISNVINKAAKAAEAFDKTIDLSGIKVGANDEIFQGDMPVLTGIDLRSTYVYLLEAASNRTADTWEIYLLDRKEYGLNLEESINDGAKAIKKGVTEAYPDIQIQLDVWHALELIGKRVTIYGRKAYSLISEEEEIRQRIGKKGGHKDKEKKLEKIESEMKKAIEKYDTMQILVEWLRELLGFTGYCKEDVKMLIEYVLSEMEIYAKEDPKLKKHIDGFRSNIEIIITFIVMLKKEMEKYSKEQGIAIEAYEMMYGQLAYDKKSEKYNKLEHKLRRLLMKDYDGARKEFEEILSNVKRASSLVENLNSRIRTYMNVKRMVPTGFFTLMKVYFNTTKYARSRCEERKGKSPLELLTGKEQPEFLEAIGF